MITGYLSGHTCGDACWHAKDLVCHCSCGGKNHGIFSRGGNQPERTCKIGGQFYKLVEVGTYAAISKRVMEELRAINHYWLLDPNGPWCKRPATKTQADKWPEVAAFKGDEKPYLLWQQITLPERI